MCVSVTAARAIQSMTFKTPQIQTNVDGAMNENKFVAIRQFYVIGG